MHLLRAEKDERQSVVHQGTATGSDTAIRLTDGAPRRFVTVACSRAGRLGAFLDRALGRVQIEHIITLLIKADAGGVQFDGVIVRRLSGALA